VSRARRNETADKQMADAFSDAVFVRRVEDAEVTPKRK
jgi:hypothetical protein